MSNPIYGVMAEFDNPTALVNAARAAREKGYRKLDAYSPFPIEELTDALHLHKNKLPLIVLIGGIIGGTAAATCCSITSRSIYFPINIGGRPLHSWPSYIVITFEMTILFAALSAVFGPAGAVRPAHAVPPGVQRAAIRAGLAQPVLPVHRGDRSAVRSRTDQRVSGDAGAQGGVRSCALDLDSSARLVLLAGSARSACRQDMHDQPKYIPLRPSDFFADGRSARPLVEGTVARGHLDDDARFYTGKGPDGKPSTQFPFPVTKDVLERGQERFNIYCSPCHDRARQRQRHDRAARLPASAVVPHRPPAAGAQRLHLRRDHQRLRRHAGLRRADSAARPLGHRGLHPRAAIEPERHASTTCRRPRTAADANVATGRREMMAQTPWISSIPHANSRTDLRQWRTRAGVAGIVGAGAERCRALHRAAGPVLPLVPVVVHLLSSGLPLGCAGVAHAAVPHRRRLGRGDPPALRGRRAHAAAGGADVPAHRDRHPQPVSAGRTPTMVAADPVLQHKQPYLNVPFFLGRAGVLFRRLDVCSPGVSTAGRRRKIATGDAVAHRQDGALAGPGLMFWGFSVTFMSIDWVLSLDPQLVLHDVRPALHGQPGTVVDGVPDHR